MALKVYPLPERLRGVLSREYGFLVEGVDRVSVARRAIMAIHHSRRVWSVGDVVTKSLVEAGFIPHVAIVDRATLRGENIEIDEVEGIYSQVGIVMEIRNPRGTISSEAINTIKYIAGKPGERFLVVVEGEEDLLSLLVAAIANYSEILLYGIPRRGIAVVEIDQRIRAFALNILREILGEDYSLYLADP
ncbi:MAG: DUF359 domain-containing protein [Desulfurococcales archaeon]|jgi:uncharacterized protein (UPF0218 family)